MRLPTGYLMTWGGQFENQQRAMKRFGIVVPITIAAIFLFLFSSFNSVKQASHHHEHSVRVDWRHPRAAHLGISI